MWWRLADRALHARLRSSANPDLAGRAQILLALCALTTATGLALAVAYLAGGAWQLGLALLVAATLLGILPWLPRSEAGFDRAANVFVFVWLLVTATAAWMRGGVESHAAAALSIVPMVAVVLQGVRRGLYWACATTAVLLLLWLADAHGLIGEDIAKDFGETLDGIAVFALLCVIFGVAAAHDRLKGAYLRRAAEHARGEAEARAKLDAAERERQLMRTERLAAVGQLAAGVAHEINNPLAYVIGNIEYTLQKLPAGSAVRGPLEEALSGAQRIRSIVQGLRVFSRDIDDAPHAIDAADAVQAALRITEVELRPRARIECDLGSGYWVHASEGRLVQVLVNLLINAAQAIEPGHPEENTVRVSLSRPEEHRVRVTVSDTGSGIDPEVMDRIFDPFFTTKPLGIGTGLGLSVCRGIVEAFGGRIWLESTPGEGTEAHVELEAAPPPLAVGAGSDDGAPPAEARRSTGTAAGTHRQEVTREEATPEIGCAAIVDDDPLVRRALARLLPAREVRPFASGEAVLEALEAGLRPEVIFCDLMMPGLSGPEVYRRIEAVDPRLARRVVFITGGAVDAESAHFLDSTRQPVVGKPFRRDALAAALSEVARRAEEAGGPPEA